MSNNNISKQKNINTLTVDLNLPSADDLVLKSLVNTGSVILKNHTVPVHLFHDVIAEWKQFFSTDEKNYWLRTDETDEGFIPVNTEMAKKGEIPDFKELYQAHFGGKYPSNIDIKSTLELFDGFVMQGEKIIASLDAALPISIKNQMSASLTQMTQSCKNHLLRVIHYPSIEKGVIIPRAAAHTDICLFTIIPGVAFNGLELQDFDGNWYELDIEKSDLLLFTSEMLELSTKGYLKGVFHRVKANPNSYTESRYSIPMAFHPLRQAKLKEDLTAAQHLKNRLTEMGYGGSFLNTNDY